MCGINGIYSKTAFDDIKLRVNKMGDAIKHRGPDSQGCYIHNNKVAFSFRRLSIQDLSASSDQPMHSLCGRYVLLFNGEIYNFQELKSLLSHKFKTKGDTEVVLAALIELGIERFLSIANGMFSISFFDKLNNEIYLIRDRLGIKPLFYYYDNEKVIFSSEIKGVLSSGLISSKFNFEAIDEYLAFRYVRDPYTFFEQIYAVKPGHYLRFNLDIDKYEVNYWTLNYQGLLGGDIKEEELIENVDVLLQNSIKYRLISDVPVGTYLSGGLDSSLITAMAANFYPAKINTFVTGFAELNEFIYARIISNLYSTNHKELIISQKKYLDNLLSIIKYKDAPIAVPNEIPLALLSTKLSQKIKVVLSGEGADEVFAGYGRIFKSGFDYDSLEINSSFYDYFMGRYEYTSRTFRDNYITSSKSIREKNDSKYLSICIKSSREEFISRFFMENHLPGLLYRLDSTTMLAGVEARVPMLDHNLVEYVFKNIRFDQKIVWKSNTRPKQTSSDEYSEVFDIPKAILKSVANKYVPEEIINRKKVGFPVPLQSYKNELLKMAEDLLIDLSWLKIDDRKSFLRDIDQERNSAQVLFMLISLQMFKNYYFEKDWRY